MKKLIRSRQLRSAVDKRELTHAINIIEECGYTDEVLILFLLAASQRSTVLGGEA